MGKFEDQLLADLIREHGPDLADAHRPKRRGTKPAWITAGAVAVAGATTGAILLWPTSSPAYAVTDNGDGTVTVDVTNVSAVEKSDTAPDLDFVTLEKCGAESVVVRIQSVDRKLKEAIANGAQTKSLVVHLPGCPPQTVHLPLTKK